MAKPFNSDCRIKFRRGQQKNFIVSCLEKSQGADTLADFLRVSPRTIRDWRREKFLMPYQSARIIAKKYHVKLPKNINFKERFWYTSKGARKGGFASYWKQGGIIGNPEVRRQRWYEWWKTTGKFKINIISKPKSFNKPKMGTAFAEFIGIMMGDGGMSKRQISITLHHIDDLPYSKFVIRLIKNLFDITPSIYHIPKDSVKDIVISRSGLVKYLHEFGLPIGNKVKQGLDIPDWIKQNKSFRIACVRGLVDTDGCVFTHRYRVNGKWYNYKKLAFTTLSPPLLQTVYDIFKEHGLHPRFSQNKDVRLDSIADMKRYFEIIGSHNPKHLQRYKD